MSDKLTLLVARLAYGALIWLGLMIFVSVILSVVLPVEWAAIEYGKGPAIATEPIQLQYYSLSESFYHYFVFAVRAAILTPLVYLLPFVEWVYLPKVPFWWVWVSWAWIWIPVIAYLLKPAFREEGKKNVALTSFSK